MYSRQSGPGGNAPGAPQQGGMPTGPNQGVGNNKPPSDFSAYGGYGELKYSKLLIFQSIPF